MTHTIIIAPSLDSNQAPRHNSRGALFDVSYHGQIIVTATTEPCLDGARALKAMGITGKLEMWDDVTPYVRLTADIATAAKKTIREGDEPPRLVKYVSFAPRSTLDGDFGSEATLTPLSTEMLPLDEVVQSVGGSERWSQRLVPEGGADVR
jgi:hypothetical protein